ncbi:MAG: hypothetical protein LC800_05610 [Acidobacteria bacterium]|nr:hypothetical protein [Acidobacteriota bacterium]
MVEVGGAVVRERREVPARGGEERAGVVARAREVSPAPSFAPNSAAVPNEMVASASPCATALPSSRPSPASCHVPHVPWWHASPQVNCPTPTTPVPSVVPRSMNQWSAL